MYMCKHTFWSKRPVQAHRPSMPARQLHIHKRIHKDACKHKRMGHTGLSRDARVHRDSLPARQSKATALSAAPGATDSMRYCVTA